jgi:hypothetical protein
MQNVFTVTLPLLVSVTTNMAPLHSVFPPPPVMNPPPIEISVPFSIIQEEPTLKTATKEVAPEKPKEKRLICKGCNNYESKTLDFLQNNGISDKNALATIMGNIKQESTFIPNICEGGAKVSYSACRSGGYGLIQFTDAPRYYGLGKFAARIGGDPSTLDTQLRYIITEPQWRGIEDRLKVPGKPIEYYMRLAYTWLGWGHKGARTEYAYNYSNKLVLTVINS